MFTFGNSKLPSSTAIFNMTAGMDCPSFARGLCQAINERGRCVCYARRTEKRFSAVLKARRRQGIYWAKIRPLAFVEDALEAIGRRAVDALRLNVSGDFRHQRDVDKAEEIADRLGSYGIRTYCYTARSDLSFRGVSSLIVTASGDWTRSGIRGRFVFVPNGRGRPARMGSNQECPGDCRTCVRCLRGCQSFVREH